MNEDDRRFRREFPALDAVAQLAGLQPAELFARWLEGVSLSRFVDLDAAEGRIPRERVEQLAEEVRGAFRYRALGWVPAGDRIAYIIASLRHDGPVETDADDATVDPSPGDAAYASDLANADLHPQIRLCRRQPDGGWLLIADHGFAQRLS